MHEGRAACSSVGDSFASLMLVEAAHATAPGASLAAALPRSSSRSSWVSSSAPIAEATGWFFLLHCPASERCLVGGRGYAGSACSDPLAWSPVLATVGWLLSGFFYIPVPRLSAVLA